MALQPNDPVQWLATLYQAGQDMMRPFMPPAGSGAPPAQDPYAQLTAMSRGIIEMQQNYMAQVSKMWLGMAGATAAGAEAPGSDKRFAGTDWQKDPRYDMLTRTYLAYSDLLNKSVESAAVDDKTRGQLRFATRQFIDAMSPANFLATNPEAMRVALETGGASLTEGMGLFFKDLAKGRISITDEHAFEVGGNIAVTPGTVVFQNELIQVIQYTPTTPKVYARPLVMIPPCINKYYILDLTPENSFVRYAVEQGHQVFMLSWRNVGASEGHFTWDDYLEMGVGAAIDVARDVTGSEDVNALGFCIGGTLLSCTVAARRANGDDAVAGMTLLTSMLDFTDSGEIGTLVTEDSVASRERSIGKGGVMEGKDLALTFSALRANDLIWPYVVNSYLKGKGPPPFDLLYWNSDGTNLPGPMFCWYVRNTYLENNVREPGRTIQAGAPVDLGEIDVPAFVYASRDDHIVPWRTAYASIHLLGGENTFVLGASGHIAGVINPPTKNKRNYWVGGTEGEDADQWLASATSVPGSWWPTWAEWIAPLGGKNVDAPRSAGNRRHRSIEPAPGSYVKAKAP
jgi:polyhydroxyalkanoate synthase